jgi:hypothetical protein
MYTEGRTGRKELALEPEPLIHCLKRRAYRWYMWCTAPAPHWTACDAATAERRAAWAMLGHARLGESAGWASALCAEMLACLGLEIWANLQQARYAQRSTRPRAAPKPATLRLPFQLHGERRWTSPRGFSRLHLGAVGVHPASAARRAPTRSWQLPA